jgi:hypothetical protein
MQQQLDRIEAALTRTSAETFNASATLNAHFLRAVPGANGATPAHFLATLYDLRALADVGADALVAFYRINPASALLRHKVEAIERHIGIRQ